MSRIPVSATSAASRLLTAAAKKRSIRSPLAAAVAGAVLLLPNISQAQSFYESALPETSSHYAANDTASGISAEQPKSFVELGLQAQGVNPYRNSGTASPAVNTSPTVDEAKTFVERALLAQGFLDRRS